MRSIIALGFLMSMFTVSAQYRTNPEDQNIELGKVSWYRDYDQATMAAKQQNKAVLILFQEVPGCSTCQNYGHNVLSHPLMAEAIQNLFIPLAIYNNKGGADRIVLAQYNEPTWNNPVIRIVDHQGINLVKRVAGNYSARGLYEAMFSAINLQRKPIPEYFKLLGTELSATGSLKEKYYKMYCFWSGEKHLGAANGVLKTESGFINGAEVVKVQYDPQVIDEEQLTNYASKARIFPISDSKNYRVSTRDYHYYLQHSNYQYLPLTELQKTRINSALGRGDRAEKYLSPQQLDWFKKLSNPGTKRKILLEKSISEAWISMKE